MKIMKTCLLAGSLLVSPAFAAAAENIDERRNMPADGTVTVSNVAGEISITTWDRNEIHLTGDLGNGSELEIKESSKGIQIEVISRDRDHFGFGDRYDETDLELVIPAGASIVASGISADITITGSRGESVAAESVSGDVDVEARVQRIELSSVSGDVEFEGSSSRSWVESVSGDIELRGVSGEVSVSLVSGDLDLDSSPVSRGKFESVSGTLNLSLSVAEGGRLTVESMSGDVILSLPGEQSGEFSAQTFSGDIRSKFGEAKQESHGPGSHLKHVSGDSGSVIRVETFSGDIRIGHK